MGKPGARLGCCRFWKMSKRMQERGGHLYLQTNEVRNSVIHYRRARNGVICEAGRVSTGGSGSGTLNYRSSPFGIVVEGAYGVILTPGPAVSVLCQCGGQLGLQF